MKRMKGLYPALVTPFDPEGRLDIHAAQKLVERLSEKGVDGFYVGGSTGESYLLSMEERKRLLEAVVEACPQGKAVIANISMMATEHSIALARHAEKLGVAAISSVPPFYFPFSMDEYMQYYADLADSVDVPVLIYNIPAMSGVRFDKDSLDRLLSNEKVMGLKHTSYDLFQLQLLIRQYPDKTFFIGHDELFLSALAIGAVAGIGSTYNIMPEKFIRLAEYYQTGLREKAIAQQAQINEIISVLLKVGIFKGIKEVLRLQGIDCGACRKPFQPLTDAQKREIHALIDKRILRIENTTCTDFYRL